MQEINAAWAVLGDPAERARYDDELPARRPPVVPRAPAGSRPRPTAAPPVSDGVDDGAARDALRDADREGECREPRVVTVATEIRAPRWLVWAPLVVGLIVVGLLAVGLVLGSHTGPSGGPVTPDGAVPAGGSVPSAAGFAVGDCVALVPDPTHGPTAAPLVVAVSCDEEHTGRILSRPAVSTDCPAGTTTVVVPGDPRALCLG